MSTIAIYVESEPYDQDLSGVMLDNPAPNGSFVIDTRVDRPVWAEMKAAGANYWSAGDLEELDMFQSTPGWRYSLDAIVVLLRHGHSLSLRGETVTTEAQLRGLFTAQAKAAYHARIKAERKAAEQARRRAARRAEKECAVRGASYAIWQQVFLVGLVGTSIGPDYSAGVYGADGLWTLVYRAEKGTPGASYDTGDTWYQSPSGVLRRDYGNASLWYAPQEIVDSWVLARDTGSVGYARHVLIHHGYGVYGSDVADRLVELRGLDHYLDRARSEEWLVKAPGPHDLISRGSAIWTAQHYGIPVTPIALRKYDHKLQERIQQTLGYTWLDRDAPQNVGQAPDGRWFSTANTFNGGGWRLLTADECAALDLNMTPPAELPVL